MIHVLEDFVKAVNLHPDAKVVVFPRKKQYENTRVSDFISVWPRCLNRIIEVFPEMLDTWHMVFRVCYVVSSMRGKTNDAARLNHIFLGNVSTLSLRCS